MYKQLATERLFIRPIQLADANFIIALVNTEGWLKFIGDRNIHDQKDAEIYIQKILNNPQFYYSVFELKDNHLPIGIVTFLHREGYEHPDIGFALLPEYAGQGYAFEASRKYLDEILKEKKWRKIVGITIPENTASIKLLEKLGLIYVKNFIDEEEELSLYELINV